MSGSPRSSGIALKVLGLGTLVSSALWALLLLTVFALRISFPLELEWMEGGTLHHAQRLADGSGIYLEPSEHFVPYLYPPVYPGVLAVLGKFIPLDYWLARLVSILASVAIGAAIWRAVSREGKDLIHCALAVGLFCSGYVFSFRWLDLARPDALYLAFASWALVLLRESWGRWKRAVFAGLLIGVAFWTKQTAFLLILSSGLAGLFVVPRQLWAYVLSVAVIGLGGLWIGQELTDGWLWHYIYELHQNHAFNHDRFQRKSWLMFAHAGPFLLLMGVGVWADLLRPWWARTRKIHSDAKEHLQIWWNAHRGVLFWWVIALGAVLAGVTGYSTQWAEPNAFLPIIVFVPVALVVSLPTSLESGLEPEFRSSGERSGWWGVALLSCAVGQMLFSLAFEADFYPVKMKGWGGLLESYRWQQWDRTVPDEHAWKNAQAMRKQLRNTSGPILALHRPWWSLLVSKKNTDTDSGEVENSLAPVGHISSMGIHDVGSEDQARIKRALRQALLQGTYERVWFEGEPPSWIRSALIRNYHVLERKVGAERVRPMTGYMSEAGMELPYRADQLWLARNQSRNDPDGMRSLFDFEDGTLQGFTRADDGGRRAFVRPVRSLEGKLPPVGPIGGEFFLSSASGRQGLKEEGSIQSPEFRLPDAGKKLRLWLGTSGSRKKLRAALVGVYSSLDVELKLPKRRFTLQPVEWTVPKEKAGEVVFLRLEDHSSKAAIFFDDLSVEE